MHEVQGVFCKTGKLWIIAKIRRQGKTLYGPKLRQAQQKKTKGGALGCGLTQWALARSVVRWTGWAADADRGEAGPGEVNVPGSFAAGKTGDRAHA